MGKKHIVRPPASYVYLLHYSSHVRVKLLQQIDN